MTTHHLACDLGAESGRLILGTLGDGKLALEEIHRFPNTPVKAGDSLHWNIPQLFDELKAGLNKAGDRKLPIASVGCDAWGVDYLLFAADGSLMSPTFHYRDPRNSRVVEKVHRKVPWKTIFAETGIQFMAFNTLYQLAAESPKRLAQANRLLLVGDGINFLLSGVARTDESMASTTQLYNPRIKMWSRKLIRALGYPERIFTPIVPSGTRLGPLKCELAEETGLTFTEVIASCSHDTGAAVAGVPASGKNWAYISSGTWSLLGMELAEPIINDRCRELNFTNEIGYGGTIRLLKNINGLWMVQECRRDWAARGEEYDYPTLTQLAAGAPPFVSLINPADPRFLSPGDMPAKIAVFCRETAQPVPKSPGDFVRCALESLALLYRRTLSQLEELVGYEIERLHLVGGGAKNELLNQFTANAVQLPVLAEPVEATAAGNVLVQAIALGQLPSLSAARQVVRDSFPVKGFQPQDEDLWHSAYQRLLNFWQK
jgi:rhamnulokinase